MSVDPSVPSPFVVSSFVLVSSCPRLRVERSIIVLSLPSLSCFVLPFLDTRRVRYAIPRYRFPFCCFVRTSFLCTVRTNVMWFTLIFSYGGVASMVFVSRCLSLLVIRLWQLFGIAVLVCNNVGFPSCVLVVATSFIVRWYRHVFRRIRVAPFVVRRLSFFVNLALSFVVISLLPFFVLSFWRTHLRFRVVLLRVPFSFSRAVSVYRFVVREHISEGSVVSVRVSVFVRRLASCEVTFVGPFVDRRIRSVFSFTFVAFRLTMLDNVEKVTPVVPSSAGNVTSTVAPPVSSVPSVPSNVPAPSSNVAGPSTIQVAPPSSSAADAMMSSLFDTVRSRVPVASAAAPVAPSTPSEYNRYTGTVIGNVNEVVGSELEELVGSPELVMPRLDSRCLVRSDWSLRARGSFDWDDILASGRADVKRVRDLANSVGTAGVTYTERYMDYVRGAYQIPVSLRCDRMFLVEASDAKYVELVERYLFEPTCPYP